MITKILVPIDGSKNSEKGLKYACWLAGIVDAEITVMHIVSIPYTGESIAFQIAPLEDAGREILKHAEKLIEKNCAKAKYVLREGTGNAGHEIVNYAKDNHFSLIVMSAKGHSALTHLFLGSVSETVSKNAPCSILIVK
jgi:nucleotide-binding universal stress UspA family protein